MKDYASYLSAGSDAHIWRAGVTAVGYTRIPPGSVYPPGRHPLDHLFTWERGRVLRAYQVVYILSGRGTFESANNGFAEVTAGTVFLLFPGVWHRYRPDRKTGWVESWIELQGPAIRSLEQSALISAQRPVLRLGRHVALEKSLEECHRLAIERPAGYQPMLGTLGLHILALIQKAPLTSGGRSSTDEAVRKTQEALETQLDRLINIEAIAQQLNVSYSTLRHAFKEFVGSSPKQYHLQLRLRKAKDLLQNTALTIEAIADELGFGSAFHFSNVFKHAVSESPSSWRQTNQQKRVQPSSIDRP
jgi:AraC-like DNA-binding protein